MNLIIDDEYYAVARDRSWHPVRIKISPPKPDNEMFTCECTIVGWPHAEETLRLAPIVGITALQSLDLTIGVIKKLLFDVDESQEFKVELEPPLS